MVPVLARAGVASAWQACSWKPTPSRRGLVGRAQRGAPQHMRALLETLVALDDVTKKNGFLENNFGVWNMPSGYIIANVRVTNPAQYEEYKKWSTAAFQAHKRRDLRARRPGRSDGR